MRQLEIEVLNIKDARCNQDATQIFKTFHILQLFLVWDKKKHFCYSTEKKQGLKRDLSSDSR